MTDKQSKKLTFIGFLTFILGAVLILIRMISDVYPTHDASKILIFLFGVCIVLVVIITKTNNIKFKIAFWGVICPIFFLTAIASMFLVIPIYRGHVVERGNSKNTEYQTNTYWFNPFTDKAIVYSLSGRVVCNNIWITYQYKGTELELHDCYNGDVDGFKNYANPIISKIVKKSSGLFEGRIKVEQISYLYFELNRGLQDNSIVFKDIGVSSNTSLISPVAVISEENLE